MDDIGHVAHSLSVTTKFARRDIDEYLRHFVGAGVSIDAAKSLVETKAILGSPLRRSDLPDVTVAGV